ncbi:hypothetical protein [Paraburkholderia sp. J76]|uniref:hypothetical protein n=1 Tax=Paraburkholderia sp. J76 TaxID=2805439 RepID=UPI002ABE8875|nr:hypothetical protein [Paraburkholderia sp. J76]
MLGFALLGFALLGFALLGFALLGFALLGFALLGFALLCLVLLYCACSIFRTGISLYRKKGVGQGATSSAPRRAIRPP